MSFNYTDTLSANRDKVRFFIGDTVSTYEIFSDEEIDATLDRLDDGVQSDNRLVYKVVAELLQEISQSPGRLEAVHDGVGRTFTMSRLVSLFSDRANSWAGT